MNSAVLDSSVLLAIAKDERYEETILDLLPIAVISTVNLAEVLTKAAESGTSSSSRIEALLKRMAAVEPFTAMQASRAAFLRAATRHAGLSLGDRACLAVALELGVPAYTTDRNWLRVDVGCPIHCLR